MLSALEKLFGDGEVGDGRGGDGCGVDGIGELLEARHGAGVILRSDLAGDLGAFVEDGGQRGAFQFTEDARVIAAHAAGADDANAEGRLR
jgi:hypothetical protein